MIEEELIVPPKDGFNVENKGNTIGKVNGFCFC